MEIIVTYADGAPQQYLTQVVPGWSTSGTWQPVTISLQTAHPVSQFLVLLESNSGLPQSFALDNVALTVQ